ncbi:Sec1 family protein [Babesia caballi]|uniref:Sec1 family protein n=1 Tax=Babesia caballi TaxID=5871 RepID=A0AAV4LWU1_BABCB|nr:Sec1 family protein [Babesia caballi]
MALVERQPSDEPRVYSLQGDETSPLTACDYEYPSDREAELLLAGDEQEKVKEESYVICGGVFARVLCALYVLSFLGHFIQDPGLVGEQGVWPANGHLTEQTDAYGALNLPNITAFLPICDTCIRLLAVAGMAIGLFVVATGMVGSATCFVLWLIKLALVTLRASLPKHNSDLLLLEVGFLAIFAYSPFVVFERPNKDWHVPPVCRWAFRFLVYRVMFCAGVAKVHGSPHWADGSGFKYMLQGVPLPNPVTHVLFSLVAANPWANAFATNAVLFTECVASVFLLVPARACRLVGGWVALVYSLLFSTIGNFGCFYLLLAACAVFCFDDASLAMLAKSPLHDLDKQDVDADDHAVEEGDGKTEENGDSLSSNIVRIVTYQSKKTFIRDAVFSQESFGMELTEQQHHRVQQTLQLLLVFCISFVTFNLILSRANMGLKAFVIFFLALLLHVQCNAVGTREAYVVVSGVMFALHIWLMLELMTNGVSMWNVWLWLGITDLQLGLARTRQNFRGMCGLLLQSVVAVVVLFYAAPLVARSIKYATASASLQAPFGVVNTYDGFGALGEHRYEVVIQGTDEPVVTTATKWKPYELPCVPGDTQRRPAFVLGYSYELDNILRDVANHRVGSSAAVVPRFVFELLRALLRNKTAATNLFASNPFKDEAPRYVRVMQYAYSFAGPRDQACINNHISVVSGGIWREKLRKGIPRKRGSGRANRDARHSDGAPRIRTQKINVVISQAIMSLKLATKERLLWAIRQVVVPFGRVILLADHWSLRVISACCTVSELLDEGVDLVELIQKKRQPMKNRVALYILSDDFVAVNRFLEDFEPGREIYRAAFVVINGHLSDDRTLRKIAEHVDIDRVLGCVELHLNYLAYEERIFHGNLGFTLLSLYPSPTGSIIHSIASRLASLCSVMKTVPQIRYQATANGVPRAVAEAARSLIKSTAVDPTEKGDDLLIVVDRSMDAATMHLHEYTYQAFVYDVLRIPCCSDPLEQRNDDVWEFDHVANSGKREKRSALLSSDADVLWKRFRHLHIQKVNELVSDEVDKLANSAGTMTQWNTTREAIHAVRQLPKAQYLLEKYWAHVSLTDQSFEQLEARHMVKAGQLEQSLATNLDRHGNKLHHVKVLQQLHALLGDVEIDDEIKVRLILLYSAVYRNVTGEHINELLDAAKLSQSDRTVVQRFISLGLGAASAPVSAPNSPRSGGSGSKICHKNTEKCDAHSFYKRHAKESEYELSRHTPEIRHLIARAVAGKLEEDKFPNMSQQEVPAQAHPSSSRSAAASQPGRIVIYVVGGITFAEMRTVYEVAEQSKVDLYLGGDSIIVPSDLLENMKHAFTAVEKL